MLKIRMEVVNKPDANPITIWLTRVPCMSEVIVLDNESAYGVRSVLHLANKHDINDYVAYIRVMGK